MRILLVEDDPLLGDGLETGLRQIGFNVDWMKDGISARAAMSAAPYDAVILDLGLPRLPGLDVLAEWRREGRDVPVLILTARDGVEDRIKGLNTGADDYLVKPFALGELVARVRALIRRPKQQDATLLTAGDLSLDTNTFEVKRGPESIELTQKEYALLEYFMRNPGRILSKEMIISHVWDYDADILPNTVEVYIKYLRNKIDKKPFKPLFETIRGFGYKLDT